VEQRGHSSHFFIKITDIKVNKQWVKLFLSKNVPMFFVMKNVVFVPVMCHFSTHIEPYFFRIQQGV
jgi:hypothetical protein